MQILLSPEWAVCNLIYDSPDWQANITDGEHVAVGTGDSIEAALSAANDKALEGKFAGRLLTAARFTEPPTTPLFDRLGFKRPEPPKVTRRI